MAPVVAMAPDPPGIVVLTSSVLVVFCFFFFLHQAMAITRILVHGAYFLQKADTTPGRGGAL